MNKLVVRGTLGFKYLILSKEQRIEKLKLLIFFRFQKTFHFFILLLFIVAFSQPKNMFSIYHFEQNSGRYLMSINVQQLNI